ncbi:phage tail tape measure protein [Rheinheimera marina]|uniref:Phage tail tape measure protein n=1 Tax=Rheinheimera marina TaxID=1774958 RepID=A0ABV9JJU8_9GAMM
MSLPKPLMFTVGLIDQITKPIAKITHGLGKLTDGYQQGTMKMAAGVGGVAASGFALQNALMPAIEMGRALGEVQSLGVQQSALKMLADTSYDYALKYGESSTEFVRSAYDIQSAIAGLNDTDLSRFTMASNVLAKGTKADAATITSYMGTMYGIFKNDAKAMGEGAWVERLTGMTALAVQAFKTDGKKMADAFGALGASAGLAPLQEQMAIMGTLQSTMQGSEAATKYKAFLAGVGKAQEKLNLKFTDTQGNMLPMVDILNKIKGKYGDVISVAEGDALAAAFGSQEATSLIGLLLKDVNGLAGSIDQLGKVNGMEQAEKMAAAMTDQSQRLSQSWYVIRAAFGSAVLPAFNEFVGKLADMSRSVIDFTSKFPNITRWLGYFAIGLLSIVAIGGLITIAMGALKMAMVTGGVVTEAYSWINTKAAATLKWLRGAILAANMTMNMWSISTAVATAKTWLYGAANKAAAATVWLFEVALKAGRLAMMGLNLVMTANPIGLLVVGIGLAIAAVGAMIYYWDDLRASMSEWGWLQALGEFVGTIWQGMKDGFISAFNWIAEKLNMLGFDIPITPVVAQLDTPKMQSMANQADFVQNAMPEWMQRNAANDSANYVYSPEALSPLKTAALKQSIDVQRNLPATYTPPALKQPLQVQRIMPPEQTPAALTQQLNVQRNLPAAYAPDAMQQSLQVQRIMPPEQTPAALTQQLNVQRNLPPAYAPDAMQQSLQVQRIMPAAYAPESLKQVIEVQRKLPKSLALDDLTQTVAMQPAANETLASIITPKVDQQAAATANAKRSSQSNAIPSKSLSFGDVIIKNPPKGFSLAEIAEQQELLAG